MTDRAWPARLRHGPVGLRPLRRRDEAAWSRIRRADPAWFQPWDATSPPGSFERQPSFGQLAGQFAARARRGQMLPWAVEYTRPGAPGEFVGQVTVSGITLGSARWAQIGYWISPAWAGQGIIPTAVAMATDYCFTTLRLHRIEIAIRPENANSLAVVRKLGFRYEGRRGRYLHVAGDWRDHDVFVLTAEEATEGVLARFERTRRQG